MDPEAHGKILLKEETGNFVHVCSHSGCSKVFSRPNRLNIHLRTHTGEKPYLCDIDGCDKQYARSTHLKRHQDTAHYKSKTTEESSICCPGDGCDLTFKNGQHLQRHVSRKHGSNIYQCTYQGCQKIFHKHQQLKTHEFEHTNVNPFVCPVEGCGYSFQVPSKLKRHMKVHAGYSCEEDGCNETFTTWTLLRKHKAVDHSQEYKCTECGKTFKQKQWLRQHRKIHSETRQVHACPRDNCGRSYLDQRNLRAHIRSYHDGRRFSCQHSGCDRKFVTEQKLKEHQKLHEGNKPPPKKKCKKSKPKTKTKAAKLLCLDKQTLLDHHMTSESEVDMTTDRENVADGKTGKTKDDCDKTLVRDTTEHDVNNKTRSKSTTSDLIDNEKIIPSVVSESCEDCIKTSIVHVPLILESDVMKDKNTSPTDTEPSLDFRNDGHSDSDRVSDISKACTSPELMCDSAAVTSLEASSQGQSCMTFNSVESSSCVENLNLVNGSNCVHNSEKDRLNISCAKNTKNLKCIHVSENTSNCVLASEDEILDKQECLNCVLWEDRTVASSKSDTKVLEKSDKNELEISCDLGNESVKQTVNWNLDLSTSLCDVDLILKPEAVTCHNPRMCIFEKISNELIDDSNN